MTPGALRVMDVRQPSAAAVALDWATCHPGLVPMSDNRIQSLVSLLTPDRVLVDGTDLAHYGRDWTRWWTPAPLAVALPETIDEVQALVRWAVEHRVAVVPSGGRTGLSGGAVAANGELVVSFERMHRIGQFNALDRTLTVEPGVITENVQRAARE